MKTPSLKHAVIIVAILFQKLEPGQIEGKRNKKSGRLKPGNHNNNFAIIVSSSRSYHNYRHVSNALSFYNTLRNEGKFPDSNMILMLADDIPCNPRNPMPCTILSEGRKQDPMYPPDIEVDYRGDDVNVASLIRVLTNRHLPGTSSRRMLAGLNSSSNVLLFLTGHGGDNFFKFQDVEEILSDEIGKAIQYMHEMGLYKNFLFVADTCQAFTLASGITSPNVLSVGSSLVEENSYAHHSEKNVGASVIDRFSHTFAQFVSNDPTWSSRSLLDWIQSCTYAKLASTVGYSDDLSETLKFNNTPMSDFFVYKPELDKEGECCDFAWQRIDELDVTPTRITDITQTNEIQKPNAINVAQRLYQQIKMEDAEEDSFLFFDEAKDDILSTSLFIFSFVICSVVVSIFFIEP